jgi:hypothetical protein
MSTQKPGFVPGFLFYILYFVGFDWNGPNGVSKRVTYYLTAHTVYRTVC